MSQVWRGDDEPYDLYIPPAPRGPLSVGEHVLLAFLLVAVPALSVGLAMLSGAQR